MEPTWEARRPVYTHRQGLASGIPLGGLGTGSVELRDDGRLHDWEIFNNYKWSGDPDQAPPEMWSEDAFFALRVKEEGRGPKVRLLYHDDMRSLGAAQQYEHAVMYNFPFLRQVETIRYSGRHPFARLDYEEAGLPLRVSLEAFTPYIPFNAKDSGLPLAFFAFRVRNRGQSPCEASLMFSLRNCVGYELDRLDLRHRVARDGEAACVLMTADNVDPAHRTWGSMAVGALGPDVTCMPGWTDGRGLVGFDVVTAPAFSQTFYPFRDEGALAGEQEWSRSVARRRIEAPAGELHHEQRQFGWRWRGAVCRKLALEPGQEEEVVFLMAWFFPNHYHHFVSEARLGHMYENWFGGAEEVTRYGVEHFARLRAGSRAFCDALYAGSLPGWLADSLNAQLTTFPQSFWWTKGGDLAVWEGSACCQLIPAARTPWSSWQPLMFFPELYLQMCRRMAGFCPDEPDEHAEVSQFLAVEQRRRAASNRRRRDAFGGWFQKRFKGQGYRESDFTRGPGTRRRTALSREAGAVQTLRDFQWTADDDYLRAAWPAVRDMIEAGIEGDQDGDGLPDGAISWVTYDHWFLPATNCYKCTVWLAELRAAARLAELAGDQEATDRYRSVLETGARSFEKLLWNGEYYDLCWDPKLSRADSGCMADQVSGHLYLRLCGLGPVHDEERAASALRAVHRYNLTEEEGLLNGADPEGRDDWRYFCRYSERGDDEALAGQWVTPWTGTEYYVAATMVAEGLLEEGLDVARDVYERHVAAGMLYNHMECGEHYFRPMAAWALLPALLGLVRDAAEGLLKLAPRLRPEDFDSIFILPGLWGRVRQTWSSRSQTDEIAVEVGELGLAVLGLELPPDRAARPDVVHVERDGEEVGCDWEAKGRELLIRLRERLTLAEGQRLTAEVTWRA